MKRHHNTGEAKEGHDAPKNGSPSGDGRDERRRQGAPVGPHEQASREAVQLGDADETPARPSQGTASPLVRQKAESMARRLGFTGVQDFPLPAYTKREHDGLVQGNSQIGHRLKFICWSTMGIDYLACDERGRLTEPYPVCRRCGLVFDPIAAGTMVDTDTVAAWPALPWYVDEILH